MALLTRFIRLPDRANTHVFTFVVTRSVTRDLHRDVTSKEFGYGYHRWAITFSRAGKVLGVYLVWRNPSEGMRVYIDFSFTLLNREHFSANETFSGRQIKFTFDSPAQGNRRYIPVDDLYDRNFTDSNGEFQLELTVSNPRTIYETELRMPLPGLATSPAVNPHSSPLHSSHVAASVTAVSVAAAASFSASSSAVPSKAVKLETTYFSFGGFDWNVCVVVEPYSVTAAASAAGFSLTLASNLGLNDKDRERELRERARMTGGGEVGNGSLALRLRRLTGVDHKSRSRYYLSVGDGDRRLSSGLLDDVSDAEGAGSIWCPRLRIQDMAPKGTLRLQVELVSANTLSETFITLAPSQNTPSGIAGLGPATCYDRDKQAWAFEADTHSETLRVRVLYRDVRNVPRNHIRYVSWTASILRPVNKMNQYEAIPFSSSHYSNYYVQEEADDGVVMESPVPVKDLLKSGNGYVSEKQQLRIQVEWDETLLLFQATYHKYDDIGRIHNYQMRKEITALQSENYSLERQLFSYQRSLAMANVRNQASEDTSSTTSANGESSSYPPSSHHHHHHSSQHHGHSRGESHHRSEYLTRCESSDTEYA